MNHHKTSFTLEDSTTIIMAIIPTVLVSIISKIASKIENTFFCIVVMICSCFLSILIAYLFYVFLKEKQEYNQYKEYEGKWLQYIPGFQRKFSICELKYSKRDGWKFVGTNIDDCNYESVMFDSYKFIGDGPNSFFYVTDARASYKPEKIEGFGKVYNLGKQ